MSNDSWFAQDPPREGASRVVVHRSLTPETYLDLIRALGRIGLDRCVPECHELLHRHDAVTVLGILIDHPELLAQLNRSAAAIAEQETKT